jgi:hypothetical protein
LENGDVAVEVVAIVVADDASLDGPCWRDYLELDGGDVDLDLVVFDGGLMEGVKAVKLSQSLRSCCTCARGDVTVGDKVMASHGDVMPS